MIALASLELWLLTPGYSRVQQPMAAASALLAVYYFGRWAVFMAEGPHGPVFLAYFGSPATTLATTVLLVVVSFSMAVLSNEQQTQDLRMRATYDGLTGLLNRTAFLHLALDELHRLRRTKTTDIAP
ncbi:hypothetical protein [Pseudarthrobacter sp. N5]|uniref:hypothetical protein n=1 Tax=Pseudarthrobacter sp. N5 TaxID=3418416 RepID=UPI003CE97AD4